MRERDTERKVRWITTMSCWWITDAAHRRVRAISAASGSTRAHRVIMHLQRRVGRDWDKLARVLSDIASDNPLLSPVKKKGGQSAPRGASEADELAVAGAVAALMMAESVVQGCFDAAEKLESDAKKWAKLESRPIQLSIAQFMNMSDRAYEVIRCDQKNLQAQATSRKLMASVGRIRTRIYDMEIARDRAGLVASTARLVSQIEALNFAVCSEGFVSNNGSFLTRTNEGEGWAQLEQWGVGVGETECRRMLVKVIDSIDTLESGLQSLKTIGGSIGAPSVLLRTATKLIVASSCGVVALVNPFFRPKNLSKVTKELIATLRESAYNFYKEHMAEPIWGIYQELFVSGDEADVWRVQALQTKASLNRMLAAFLKNKQLASVAVPEEAVTAVTRSAAAAAAAADVQMEAVVRLYEEQMASPMKNLIMGDMLQSLLLQMHSMKAHMEEEAAAVHALIKANQINMQIMASVPALIFLFGVANGLTTGLRWLLRQPTHPRSHFRDILRVAHRHMIVRPNEAEADRLEHLGTLMHYINMLMSTAPRMMLMQKNTAHVKGDLLMLARYDLEVSSKVLCLECMLRNLSGLS